MEGADAPPQSPLIDEAPKLYTFRLDGGDPLAFGGARLPLLDAFRDAAVDPSGGQRRYFSGPWGRWRAQPWWPLSWVSSSSDAGGPTPPDHGAAVALGGGEGVDPPEPGAMLSFSRWLDPSFNTPVIKTPAAIFASDGFDALWSLPPSKPVPNWRCRRRPVRMARFGGESDAFLLVRCDGSVAAQAFDRLTLMARETSAPRPGELLPDEPDPEAIPRGEWTPGVRLVHPRLLWAIQRVADAFPWRTIYVFSGYRHDPSGARPKPGTHHSMHSEARALDVYVMGVPNASLFQLCHQLDDVGCGYYPNNKFVHIDVRSPGSGHPFWIDVSAPGEPSVYVDAWPGVIESGGLVWDAAATQRGGRQGEQKTGAEASCTTRLRP
jgi:Peptidase M15